RAGIPEGVAGSVGGVAGSVAGTVSLFLRLARGCRQAKRQRQTEEKYMEFHGLVFIEARYEKKKAAFKRGQPSFNLFSTIAALPQSSADANLFLGQPEIREVIDNIGRRIE